jgi:hypothetical protein
MISFINQNESNYLHASKIPTTFQMTSAYAYLLVFVFYFSGSNEYANKGIGVLRCCAAEPLEARSDLLYSL